MRFTFFIPSTIAAYLSKYRNEKNSEVCLRPQSHPSDMKHPYCLLSSPWKYVEVNDEGCGPRSVYIFFDAIIPQSFLFPSWLELCG